jgi:hypothetical protein
MLTLSSSISAACSARLALGLPPRIQPYSMSLPLSQTWSKNMSEIRDPLSSEQTVRRVTASLPDYDTDVINIKPSQADVIKVLQGIFNILVGSSF